MTNPKTPREMRQVVIDRAISKNHTITNHDVATSQTLRDVALDFIASYRGRGYFMRSLHNHFIQWQHVSIAQMRGALNAMISEYRAQIEVAEPLTREGKYYVNLPDIRMPDPVVLLPNEQLGTDTPLPIVLPPITPVAPNGTYTVPIANRDNEYRVIKLASADWAKDEPQGTQGAYYQSGPDNTRDFTFFAFVYGSTYRLKRKYHNARMLEFALVSLLETGKHAEYGRLWAMEAERCFICGRKLTVPISKKAGIGPVCAENTGIDIVALAALAGAKDQAIEQNTLHDQVDAAELALREAQENDGATGKALLDLLKATVAERQAKAQADIDELFPQ